MRSCGHKLKWGYYEARAVLVALAILVIFLEVAEGRQPRRSGGREQRRSKKSRRGVGKDFSEFLYVMVAVMTCVIAPIFMFFLHSLYKDPAVPELARAGWEALKRTLISYLGQDQQQQAAPPIDGRRNTETSIAPYASTRWSLGANDSFSSTAIGGGHGVRSARRNADLASPDDRSYSSPYSARAKSLTGRTQQQRPEYEEKIGYRPYNKDSRYSSVTGGYYDDVEYDYRFTSNIGDKNSETRRMVGGEFSSAVAPFSDRAAAASTRHAARPPWNEREEGTHAMLSSRYLIPREIGYKGEGGYHWEDGFQRKYTGGGAGMTTDGIFGMGMEVRNQEIGENGAPEKDSRIGVRSHEAVPAAETRTKHDDGVYKNVQSKRRRAAIALRKRDVRSGI